MSASVYCAHCGALNQQPATTCFACARPLDEPAPAATDARRLIHGRYRLVRQLGVGGFGAVYQAEDTTLGNRLVALKEMSPRGLSVDEAREATNAFQREALLLAGLAHPSLPRIYERFEEEGRWYLVMDFIEGETLEVYLDKQGGTLPVKEALQIALQLTEVLGYLHSRQPPIIFRDLKPSNIIRSADGHLTLVDFGIARFFKPGQSKDTIAFGSPGYAAPEQYGKAQTTPRSDIFSLGAVLHQMLTGSDPSDQPFRFAPLTMPRPAGLSALIERMVDMDEANRPPSMETIRRELTALLDERTPWRDDDLALTGASISPPGTSIGSWTVTGPVAQSAGYSGPPIQPLQASVAAQPVSKKAKNNGWVFWLVLMLVCAGVPTVVVGLGSLVPHHSGIVDFAPTSTGETYTYGPAPQFTDTAVPTGSYQATGTPSFSDAPVYSVAWSPDGTRVASGGADSSVAVWDVRTGERQSLGLLNAYGKAYSVAWSPDGRYLAAGTGPTLQIWTFPQMSYDSYDTFADITSLSWSPDNEHLVLGSADGPVRVTDILSKSITPLAGPNDYFTAVAYSPDGRYIAAGGAGQAVKIWDSATGQVVYTDQNHQGTITALAWSPDSQRIASAGYDANASLSYVEYWDALTGANTSPFDSDPYHVSALAWSPNGRRIAYGDDNGMIQIWYQAGGSPFSIVCNRAQAVHALAWSPDSNQIACASDDGTVQIWDALTGDHIVTYQQP